MEGLIDEIDIFEGAKAIWNFMGKLEPDLDREASEWVITDFDHFLKGNPHIT